MKITNFTIPHRFKSNGVGLLRNDQHVPNAPNLKTRNNCDKSKTIFCEICWKSVGPKTTPGKQFFPWIFFPRDSFPGRKNKSLCSRLRVCGVGKDFSPGFPGKNILSRNRLESPQMTNKKPTRIPQIPTRIP